MKRLVVFLCASALVVCLACPVMAGGIDNKHNFSAEYIRTLNRNAATDSADGVVYNPAGTVRMEDGFYANVTGQYAIKTYTNTIGGVDLDSDEPDLVPGVFALFSKDRWAGYAAFTIPAGGGTVEFEDGSATTVLVGQGFRAGANGMLAAPPPTGLGLPAGNYYDSIKSQSLDAESFYYGFTFGGAFELNDMFSFSLGGRYIDATELDIKASATIADSTGTFPDQTATVELDRTGTGWCGIIGLNIAPTEQFNLGIRYETKTELDFETDVKRDTQRILPGLGVLDGEEKSRDLPALLGVGASMDITPEFRAEANLTYYFNDDADWTGNLTSQNGLIDLPNTDRDNGYDLGIAFEYTFMDQWLASFGYMFTETGLDADNMKYEAPELDAHSIAGGVKWSPTDRLDLNLGVLKTFYQSETTTPVAGLFPTGVELEKDVIIIALGIQYKFW
jgi:long-chain fatty acid transport protein